MACGGCELNALFSHRSFLVVLFTALALLLPVVTDPYILFVANLLFIYTILSIGLNVLVGFAGQFALANAAMFGIGAYTTGLLQVHLGISYWLALPGGAVLGRPRRYVDRAARPADSAGSTWRWRRSPSPTSPSGCSCSGRT